MTPLYPNPLAEEKDSPRGLPLNKSDAQARFHCNTNQETSACAWMPCGLRFSALE
jgi:hypothetical protein